MSHTVDTKTIDHHHNRKHMRPWDDKKADELIGITENTFCPIQTYQRSEEVKKKIMVRTAVEAERVAKFYINDNVYLNVDPERMYHIAMQLKTQVKTPNIKKGLDCIIEVCEPSISEVVTLKSRI